MLGSNGKNMTQQLETYQMDIPTLIDRCKGGDAGAFSDLYRHYSPAIYRYLYSKVGNRQDAEELTSQTFLAVLEGLPKYRGRDKFTGWLYTIARNKAADHFRDRDNKAETLETESAGVFNPDLLGMMVQDERSQALAGLVRQLPDDHLELLRLRFVADLTFREMGEVLKRNPEGVKKAVYRLLAQLQAQLEAEHVS